ncbi:hypothetical protein J6590_048441 [Homalodisca vitripennis]|nr:hypothetical protein J6590_048441 [Homalodisca vitripennis]
MYDLTPALPGRAATLGQFSITRCHNDRSYLTGLTRAELSKQVIRAVTANSKRGPVLRAHKLEVARYSPDCGILPFQPPPLMYGRSFMRLSPLHTN